MRQLSMMDRRLAFAVEVAASSHNQAMRLSQCLIKATDRVLVIITEGLNSVNAGSDKPLCQLPVRADINPRVSQNRHPAAILYHSSHVCKQRKIDRHTAGLAIRTIIPEKIHQRIITAAATGTIDLQPFIGRIAGIRQQYLGNLLSYDLTMNSMFHYLCLFELKSLCFNFTHKLMPGRTLLLMKILFQPYKYWICFVNPIAQQMKGTPCVKTVNLQCRQVPEPQLMSPAPGGSKVHIARKRFHYHPA